MTPKQWIAKVYQWAVGANIARVVLIHDDWIYKKCKENNSQYLMNAGVVIDESLLFSSSYAPVVFDDSLAAGMLPMLNIKETLDNGANRYSAWTVFHNKSSGEKYVLIMDSSKVYTPVSTGRSESKMQSSNLFFVGKNMHPGARVWVSYMCLLVDNKVVFNLPVGINAFGNKTASSGSIELPSDIYVNPWSLV